MNLIPGGKQLSLFMYFFFQIFGDFEYAMKHGHLDILLHEYISQFPVLVINLMLCFGSL